MINKGDVWTKFYPALTTEIVNALYSFTNSGSTP